MTACPRHRLSALTRLPRILVGLDCVDGLARNTDEIRQLLLTNELWPNITLEWTVTQGGPPLAGNAVSVRPLNACAGRFAIPDPTTEESNMKRFLASLVISMVALSAVAQDSGVVTRLSKSSVPETTAKLLAAIEASGVYKVFYQLDHAANAEKEAGAKLLPSNLILFGNPKAGTSLIKEAPTLALDLPNRALVWQDTAGKVWVTYNDIASTFRKHGLTRSSEQIKAIEARQSALFEKAVE